MKRYFVPGTLQTNTMFLLLFMRHVHLFCTETYAYTIYI